MEGAVCALDPPIVLFLHLGVELLLALDDDGAVLDGDVDVFPRHAWQLRAEDQVMFLGFVNVDGRNPAATEARVLVPQIDISEQPVQPVLHDGKLPKRVDLDNRHGCFPPCVLGRPSRRPLDYASTTSPSLTSSLLLCAACAFAAFACDCL